MEGRTEETPVVRCSACHTVYEQPARPSGDEGPTGCPNCAEATWIAVEIPVSKTTEPAGA